jgi:dihydrofolate synthase/folylpolyglutamate synthase
MLVRFVSLNEWLNYLENLKLRAIDLEPGRFALMVKKLTIKQPDCPVITVAGTNGKGSVVTLLESIFTAEGHRVAAYTSPYLIEFNEQIRYRSKHIVESDLCLFFEDIDQARGDIPLTLYEYKTLAALLFFQEQEPDVWLLEVGLGGRLDPVNVIDPSIAVITSIALDHCEYLGNTREAIAREKAGILRENISVVCGDIDPPQSLLEHAKSLNTSLYCAGSEFHADSCEDHWHWRSATKVWRELPHSSLLQQNAATALMTIECLENRLTVKESSIHKGLKQAKIPGRLQVLESDPRIIVDVAHNPASVEVLRQHLQNTPVAGKTYAVFSMLNTKDISSSIQVIQAHIDHWSIFPLDHYLGVAVSVIKAALQSVHINDFQEVKSFSEAFVHAKDQLGSEDRLVVFGSFHCVAEVLKGASL